MRSAFRAMRNGFVFPTVRGAIADANRCAGPDFRIVHFSVQADHLHLIVEASDRSALSSGMRGFAIRVARRFNRLVQRRGRVWADRWHARELTTPRAVRIALGYVLANFRKHHQATRTAIDPFSSAPYFTGFRELEGHAPGDLSRHDAKLAGTTHAVSATTRLRATTINSVPVEAPRTWLLRKGWRKWGLVSLFEKPGPAL